MKNDVAVDISIKIIRAFIKDLGRKCFGINKIEDSKIIEKVINY